MKPEDEFKLSMMRDYISKLAAARQAYVIGPLHSFTHSKLFAFILECLLAGSALMLRTTAALYCRTLESSHRPSSSA